MTRILMPIVAFAALIAIGVAGAEAASPANEAVAEFRSIGNKLTVAAYRRNVEAPRSGSVQRSTELVRNPNHEIRHIGNKLTIDVSRR